MKTSEPLAAALRRLIASGELPDGARLVERDLAERFAVSRIPLREAIQQLAAEGLVEQYQNRGAMVRTLTAADIDEVYDLRMLLEGDAIYRAVQRMDAETLARAGLVHRLLDAADTREKQGELNREFHALLYAPCGNQRQLKAIRELRTEVERYERLQSMLLADTPSFQHEHADILQACVAGDADRARAMTIAHLTSAKHLVKNARHLHVPSQ
ncbi:FCD domain-containing protein [Duganella sp. FT50W]|uniref:FCD domain-containing protein n=1 Tax=Duganella lactea TaxID=2692173 RepID=A0A6L8MQH9_9BURK|nr:GntR family transcriptional regulator [Duganella lactea]MYM84015.1 FCD domain-containing protein [Duganella lactea]